VEFICLAKTDPSYAWPENISEWPAFKAGHKLWEDAAKHIREATSSNFLLTSKLTCHNKNFVQNRTMLSITISPDILFCFSF
jgi:hypothetical protein